MFFYRDTVVHAKSKDELFSKSDCPICKNALIRDWKMPLRYEPMALFRMLIVASAIAVLLCFLLVEFKKEGWLTFLNQFSYSMQIKLIAAALASICLPIAFLLIWGEIKLGHWSRDSKIAYGMRCPICGNGFVGLVDNVHSEVAGAETDSSTEVMLDTNENSQSNE